MACSERHVSHVEGLRFKRTTIGHSLRAITRVCVRACLRVSACSRVRVACSSGRITTAAGILHGAQTGQGGEPRGQRPPERVGRRLPPGTPGPAALTGAQARFI